LEVTATGGPFENGRGFSVAGVTIWEAVGAIRLIIPKPPVSNQQNDVKQRFEKYKTSPVPP
jgi:hypothetical protein